jgi:hypothetical protein
MVFSLFVVAPLFVFPQPLPEKAIGLLVLLAFLGAIAAATGNHLTLFFNTITFYLLVYPFYLQYLSGFSFVGVPADLYDRPFYYFCLFVLVVNALTLFPKRKGTSYWRSSNYLLRAVEAQSFWKFLALAVMPLAIAVFIFGPDQLFTPRNRYRTGGVEELNAYRKFFLASMKLIPFWLTYFFVLSRSASTGHRTYLGVGVLLAIAVAFANPVTTGRYISLSGLVIVLIGFLRRGEFQWIWKNSHYVVAAGVALLPLTSYMRTGVENVSLQKLREALFSLEFSSLSMWNDLFRFELASGETYNRTISSVFIVIPRAFWTSKSEGTGVEIARSAGYVYHNVGIVPIADTYLDFGILGVLLIAVAFGVVLRAAQQVPTETDGNHFLVRTAGYVALVALLPIFLRGDLGTFFNGFYSTMAAFLVSRVLCRLRFRRHGGGIIGLRHASRRNMI